MTSNGSPFLPMRVLHDAAGDDGQRAAVLGHSGDVEVARMDYYPGGKSEAYLRLLCAAPEIYEALLECVAWMDAPHRATPLQQAILATAKEALARVEAAV
jgi:hypothetical protein